MLPPSASFRFMKLFYIFNLASFVSCADPDEISFADNSREQYFQSLSVVPGVQFAKRQIEKFVMTFDVPDVSIVTSSESPTPEWGENLRLNLLQYIDESVAAGVPERDMFIIGGIFKDPLWLDVKRGALSLCALSLELYNHTGGVFDILSIPGLLSNEHLQGKLQRLQTVTYAPMLHLTERESIAEYYMKFVQLPTDEALDRILYLLESLKVSKDKITLNIGSMHSDIFLELVRDPEIIMGILHVEQMEPLANGLVDLPIVEIWLRFVNRVDVIQKSFDELVVSKLMDVGKKFVQIGITLYTRIDEGEMVSRLEKVIHRVMDLVTQDPKVLRSCPNVRILMEFLEDVLSSDVLSTRTLFSQPVNRRLNYHLDRLCRQNARSTCATTLPHPITPALTNHPGVSPTVDILIIRLVQKYKNIGQLHEGMLGCLSEAFMGMITRSENAAKRMDTIIVPWALSPARDRTPLSNYVLELAILIRKYLGLNLFARAPCLLEHPDFTPIKRESLMRGHIITYLVIAESNGPKSFVYFILRGNSREFAKFEKAMRRYAQDIRWFWRRTDMLGFDSLINLQDRDRREISFLGNK